MKAERQGRNVVLVMTPAEARALEDELLWCRADDEKCKRAWEALNELGEGENQ